MDTIEQAVKKIDPTTNISIWETGMLKHMEIGHQIHGTPMFGYAHRYFLKWFETRLQTINPKFSFFYWDSSKEFDKWSSSKIWNYLGEKEGPVTINGFKGINFPSCNSSLGRNCNVSQNPPPTEYYAELWNKTKESGYGDYCLQLEYAHGVIHNLVGGNRGQMATLQYSPIDPIFYAVHSNVDYTLLQAQVLWKQGKFSEEKSYTPLKLDSKIPGFDNVTIADVLDVYDICVSYLPSSSSASSNSTSSTVSSVNIPTTTVSSTTVTNSTIGGTSTVASTTISFGSFASVPSSSVSSTTVTNSKSAGTSTIGSTTISHAPIPTTTVGVNSQNLKNFTLDLSPEWLRMSFKNKSEEVHERANSIKKSVKEKVETGGNFVDNSIPEKSRAYVGVKPIQELRREGDEIIPNIIQNGQHTNPAAATELSSSVAQSEKVGFAALMMIFSIIY